MAMMSEPSTANTEGSPKPLPMTLDSDTTLDDISSDPLHDVGTAPDTMDTNDDVEPTLTAAQRVLGIIELLEMILLNLPVTSLFVSQSVNTVFLDTIKDSFRLRRAMFLESDPDYQEAGKQLLNPIFQDVIFEPKPGLSLELIKKKDRRYRGILFFRKYRLPYFASFNRRSGQDRIWLGHVHETKNKHRLPYHRDIQESWKKMLLKQGRPAVTSVRLWYRPGEKMPVDYAKEKIQKEETLEKLWEFIQYVH